MPGVETAVCCWYRQLETGLALADEIVWAGIIRGHLGVGRLLWIAYLGRWEGEIHFAGLFVWQSFWVGWAAKHFQVAPSECSQGGSATGLRDGIPKDCSTVHRNGCWHVLLHWSLESHFCEALNSRSLLRTETLQTWTVGRGYGQQTVENSKDLSQTFHW